MSKKGENIAYQYGRINAPLTPYAFITFLFIAFVFTFFYVVGQMNIQIPRIGILDMIILGFATHKISWLIAGDVVLSWIRAPFTKFMKPMGPGAALHEMARGRGVRFALGELLICPWCIGMWIAAAFVFGFIIAPGVTHVVAVIFAVLMLADFLQVVYIKFGGDVVHYSDPSASGKKKPNQK